MITRYNYSLKNHNTFGIDVRAGKFIGLRSVKETGRLFEKRNYDPARILVLGAGSNILFTGDYDGLIIKPLFHGIIIEKSNTDTVTVTAEAGLEWDKFVEWAVKNELAGIENLSLIPGNVGAAPIQNIGAYGVEVSETITRVHTVRMDNGRARSFLNHECKFGYRESIFKHEMKGKFLITAVEFRLGKRTGSYRLSYGNLEERVKQKGEITLSTIREAVIDIRNEKLPDYKKLGNAGSFFKNPVIGRDSYLKIKDSYTDLPAWETADGRYKIAAAWLIEKDGWKGKTYGSAGVHANHALVLINHGNATGKEIMEMSEKIITSVKSKFNIELEREVNVF